MWSSVGGDISRIPTLNWHFRHEKNSQSLNSLCDIIWKQFWHWIIQDSWRFRSTKPRFAPSECLNNTALATTHRHDLTHFSSFSAEKNMKTSWKTKEKKDYYRYLFGATDSEILPSNLFFPPWSHLPCAWRSMCYAPKFGLIRKVVSGTSSNHHSKEGGPESSL